MVTMNKASAALAFWLLVVSSAWAKPGTSKNLGKRAWPAIHAAAAIGQKMYVLSGFTLLVADEAGKATDLYPGGPPDWGSPELLTALDGKLYVITEGALYEVDPRDGRRKKLGDGYRYPAAIAGLRGKLYVASDDGIWVVDKQDGSYKKFTDRDWYNVHAIVPLDGKLYVSCGEHLVEVDPAGRYKELAGTWTGVSGMTVANGKLYVFTNDPSPVLHQADKTGQDTPLPLPKDWKGNAGINAIVALGDKLFLFAPGAGHTVTLFSVDTR